MKILSLALIAIVLTSSIGQAQAAQAPAELTKYTDQQRWNRAARFGVVWTTVAISLGKSKGMKIEEIGEWLGRQYAPGWSATMTAKGLVDGFHRNMMSAPDAIFEITSNSDGVITWRTNRPYLAIFGDSRTLYGVTVEEYEQVMVLIDRAIAQRANLELTEKVEGAWWVSTVRPDPVTEALRAGQQLMRDGKADEALASYLRVTEQFPASAAARIGVGVHLDLMGRYAEARTHFTKALGMDLTPALEAQALRSMAMAYAFESNCKDAIPFEQRLYERYLTKDRDSNMAGEIANELARVCLESGDFDTAAAWYKRGYDAGLQEPTTSAARKDLSQFRWHHAQARIAIRKGNKPEAEKQVAAAKAVLDKGTNPDQAPFYPYLVGYVAFYAGDYKAALAEFQKGNQNDPFILNLIAQSHEKLGDQAAAMAHYRKVMGFTTHNPANAFARPFARKKLGL